MCSVLFHSIFFVFSLSPTVLSYIHLSPCWQSRFACYSLYHPDIPQISHSCILNPQYRIPARPSISSSPRDQSPPLRYGFYSYCLDAARLLLHPAPRPQVHMLDIECFTYLNRALESTISPYVILATNRGLATIRGTEGDTINGEGMISPHGMPIDLLDRCMIVRTLPYAREEILTILGLRAKVEGLKVGDEAREWLADQGVKTSLRWVACSLFSLLFPLSSLRSPLSTPLTIHVSLPSSPCSHFSSRSRISHLSPRACRASMALSCSSLFSYLLMHPCLLIHPKTLRLTILTLHSSFLHRIPSDPTSPHLTSPQLPHLPYLPPSNTPHIHSIARKYRFALQLLTPASILSQLQGRTEITLEDVQETDSLFLDARSSARQLHHASSSALADAEGENGVTVGRGEYMR